MVNKMNNRKIPMRKCVSTGEMKPKKEMIRIVRTTEGEVKVDATGKLNGRGAYLTLSEEVILLAKKKGSLQRHLEVKVDDSIYNELLELAAKA